MYNKLYIYNKLVNKSIDNKKASKFLKFDIVDFYPSIIEKLLDNSLFFTKHDTTISDQEIKVLKHSRKGFLFDSNDIWTKILLTQCLM